MTITEIPLHGNNLAVAIDILEELKATTVFRPIKVYINVTFTTVTVGYGHIHTDSFVAFLTVGIHKGNGEANGIYTVGSIGVGGVLSVTGGTVTKIPGPFNHLAFTVGYAKEVSMTLVNAVVKPKIQVALTILDTVYWNIHTNLIGTGSAICMGTGNGKAYGIVSVGGIHMQRVL